MNKTISGLIGAMVLASGGTVVVDSRIDPYTDAGTKLEIAAESALPGAGEIKTSLSKESPSITFSKWNGEASMKVSYGAVKSAGSRALFTDKMEWKDSKQEVRAYPIEATSSMEDGGFEMEVVLKEKPDTNVFDFSIAGSENMDFFYQPSLTLGEIKNGASRPEDVVGSYAVYSKVKSNHVNGQVDYSAGKLFHIFRPKAIDAKGEEVWGELGYSKGILTVTIPNSFLENATYPIIVDPTFGYTTLGASAQSLGSSVGTSRGQTGTGITNSVLNSITIGARRTIGASSQTFNLFYSNSASLQGNIFAGSPSIAVGTAFAFLSPQTASGVLSGATQYISSYTSNLASVDIAYDSGTGLSGGIYDGNTGMWSNDTTRNYSIYATYSLVYATSKVTLPKGQTILTNGEFIIP